jgi:hypothetical protein
MKRFFFLPLLVGATLAEVPRVEVIGLAGEPALRPPAPIFYITAGRPLRLNLIVEAPLGSSVDLSASARYLTQGHQAALPKAFPLANQLRFEDTTRQVVAVEIPTPRLTGPAVMRYDLHTAPPGNAEVPPHFHVRITPPAEQAVLTRSLNAALEKSGRRLAVYGESPRLRRLFEAYGIEFQDLGTLRPSALPKASLTVSEDAPPRGEAVRGRLVLFHQAPERPLPGIYQQATTEGRVTIVTLPVWTNQPPSLLIEILCEELL